MKAYDLSAPGRLVQNSGFNFYIVAKLNVFGIEFRTAGNNQNPLFGSFHHCKINSLTSPSSMPAGTNGSIIKII
jgi:hypothetical protein